MYWLVKHKNISLIVILLSFQNVYTDILPYISPGFTIAWNSRKMKSASWKISIGVFSDKHAVKLDGYFCNITLGKRYLLSDFTKDYLFTECEGGIFKSFMFYGSGIGIASLKKDQKTKHVPKFSIFAGDVFFLRSDWIIEDKRLDIDIGGTLVLPLNKSYVDYLRYGM